MSSGRHPKDEAQVYVDILNLARSATLASVRRPMDALVNLHIQPMPWRVRLSVLVTGVIPYSYLKDFD